MKRVFWAFLLITLFSGVATVAQEGIPMGNAVFYPSVEAIYMHTDNIYLLDDSEPLGNISDWAWSIRPKLGFEFPFEMSYVRLDFEYMYRDYNKFNLDTNSTYAIDFVGDFNFRNGAKLSLNNEFIQGVQDIEKVDPGYETTFGNQRFNRENFEVDLDIPIGKLNSLTFDGGYNRVKFSDSDDELRPFYNYTQSSIGAGWKYKLDPTNFLYTRYGYLQNRPDQEDSDIYLRTSTLKKYNQNAVIIGWQGSVNQRMTGHAEAGYKSMSFSQNDFSNFNSWILDAGVAFAFTETLKMDLNLTRDGYQSAYNANNYYTSTGGTAQLHQQVSRYFFWTAGYMYQKNKYPESVVWDPLDPAFSSLEYWATQGQIRRDTIKRLFGELGFHVNRQISFRLNYRNEDRKSNIYYIDALGQTRRPYSYDENRLVLQAQLAW